MKHNFLLNKGSEDSINKEVYEYQYPIPNSGFKRSMRQDY
jgi:hypothetical protein